MSFSYSNASIKAPSASIKNIDASSIRIMPKGGGGELIDISDAVRSQIGLTQEQIDLLNLYASAEGRNITLNEDGTFDTIIGRTYVVESSTDEVYIENANGGFWVNGELVFNSTNTPIINEIGIGRTSNGQVFTARDIKNEKLRINGVLARDIRACIDNKGRACMFDYISKTLFYNIGTSAIPVGMTNQQVKKLELSEEGGSLSIYLPVDYKSVEGIEAVLQKIKIEVGLLL